MKGILARSVVALMMFFSLIASASVEDSWQAWVQGFRAEALQDGIKPDVFETVFRSIPGPNPTVLKFYNTQPERRLTFLEYRQTRANSQRIQAGRTEYQKNKSLLNSINQHYGVNSCVIVALWGLETEYGHFMGKFSVPNSLATLAYASKRKEFFRHQLLLALHMIQDKEVNLNEFKGEWAGASGYPQFLPSSWLKYAVDYSGSGRKNIWTNLPDGLASIANYLAKNGWRSGEPWAVEVMLPQNFDETLLGKTTVKPISAWQNLGVVVKEAPWPASDLAASIIQPGSEGPYLMIFNNFRVLQSWNDSNYYVSTVGYLADRICQVQ